jgi:hypothetical protein
MKTRSTEEAMSVLQQYRAGQIEDAREVAAELIDKHGTTHSFAVQEVMAKRGLIDPVLGNYWIGAVFNDPKFVWTGSWHFPPNIKIATKNKAHALRPVKIWTFSANKTIWMG